MASNNVEPSSIEYSSTTFSLPDRTAKKGGGRRKHHPRSLAVRSAQRSGNVQQAQVQGGIEFKKVLGNDAGAEFDFATGGGTKFFAAAAGEGAGTKIEVGAAGGANPSATTTGQGADTAQQDLTTGFIALGLHNKSIFSGTATAEVASSSAAAEKTQKLEKQVNSFRAALKDAYEDKRPLGSQVKTLEKENKKLQDQLHHEKGEILEITGVTYDLHTEIFRLKRRLREAGVRSA